MEIKKSKIVVSCSGASNTGSYSDLVSRKLMQSGDAKMLCLARFSIDKEFAGKTRDDLIRMGDSGKVYVIDGCPINCAEKIIALSGFSDFEHINITDYNIIKGQTPVTEEKINEIVEFIKNKGL